MAGAVDDVELGLRDERGELAGVVGWGLLVERTNEHPGRHVDRPEQVAGVVRDEAVDRSPQRVTRDAGHRRSLPGAGGGGDVWPGDAGEDAVGELDRFVSGVERRQADGPPLIGRRAVESELRARGEEREAEHTGGVSDREVLGDHPAERDAGKMERVGTELVSKGDDGIGQCGERDGAGEAGRRAVPGRIPGDDPCPVGERSELWLPGDPTTAEPVQQHEWRRAVPRFAPREPGSVDVARGGAHDDPPYASHHHCQ